MNHYSEARAIDCFDNDLPGRIYGVRMVGLLEGLHLYVIKQGDTVIIKTDGKNFPCLRITSLLQNLVNT